MGEKECIDPTHIYPRHNYTTIFRTSFFRGLHERDRWEVMYPFLTHSTLKGIFNPSGEKIEAKLTIIMDDMRQASFAIVWGPRQPIRHLRVLEVKMDIYI